MRDFIEWVFDLHTPEWVSVVLFTIAILALAMWVIAVLVTKSVLLFIAPFAVGFYYVIEEYKRHKEGDE